MRPARTFLIFPVLLVSTVLASTVSGCGDKDDTGSTGDGGASTDGGSTGDGGTSSDGGSAGDGGSASTGACTDALEADSACFDLDGSATLMPFGAAYIGSGSGEGLLRMAFSSDGANTPPWVFIDYPLETTAGSISCDSPTVINLAAADGTAYSADSALEYFGTECSITLSSTGSNVGDAVEGTFTAIMYTTSDGSTAPVSGSFKTSIQF